MSSPSNLYAEKVFAEHPIAMWALDDTLDFLSLLDENDKMISTSSEDWDISGASRALVEDISELNPPILNAHTAELTAEASSTSLIATSRELLDFSDLDYSKGNFNVSTYFRAESEVISKIEIGYHSLSTGEVLETYTLPPTYLTKWLFISKTFDIPVNSSGIVLSGPFSIVIKITYKSAVTGGQKFYINGISCGQWSEQFNMYTTGVIPSSDPLDTIAIEEADLFATTAASYGLQSLPGYYLSDSERLYATNSGVPMVFGAYSVTKLFPPREDGIPSLILPGQGFLNDSGKYKSYTVEMWLRVDSKSFSQRRIFGPINSADGLYVDGQYLTLKIGSSYRSHSIREWNRPMLVDIKYTETSAGLTINGEQVFDMTLSNTVFPSRLNPDGLENDWLGFYAYEDVPVLEVDCVAIYSYIVPEIVIKRRFVYGQGVDFPENLNTGYNGKSVYVDYKFSNYSKSYTYPDIGRWKQGTLENISVRNNYLETPVYPTPTISIANPDVGQTSESFLSAVKEAQSGVVPYISMVPDESWEDTYTYLTFPNINFMPQPTEAFYVILQPDSVLLDRQTLVRIENQVTRDYLDISLFDDEVRYAIRYGEAQEVVFYSEPYDGTSVLQVGMNITRASSSFGSSIRSFFGSKDSLVMYVAGLPTQQDRFIGKVYKIGLSTKRNARKISNFFNSNGILISIESVFEDYLLIPDEDIAYDGGEYIGTVPTGSWNVQDNQLVLDGGAPNSFDFPRVYGHVASYTLVPNTYLGEFILDTFVDSYWQDYVPLKYFAKKVTEYDESDVYDLDYMQFNVDYPLLETFVGDAYSTTPSNMRFYVTFRYLSDRTSPDPDFLTFSEQVPQNNVILPRENWLNTKYEVGNNSIIYAPEGEDFNRIAMFMHIEFKGASRAERLTKVNSLSISGNALNKSKETEIGTRFGFPIVPSTSFGFYPDYRSKNPFVISKKSAPYLYLDGSTGIGLRPFEESRGERSLRVKVNPDAQKLFRIGAMQIATKYAFDRFPERPEQVFEISSRSETIKMYVVSANQSGTRGRLYARNAKTKGIYNNISFYINGNSVKEAYLDIDTWHLLGFQFPIAMTFDEDSLGYFSISGKIFVNNILFYQVSADANARTTLFRNWGQASVMLNNYTDDGETSWEDFIDGPPEGEAWGTPGSFIYYDDAIKWEQVLVVDTDKVIFIDPQKLYQTYLGVNKTVVSDETSLVFKNYKYTSYSDVVWRTNTITPV